ncbi:carboxyl-terminal processing protease [Alkalicoccobacillus murimartini]|uniref:Carboxyl-terminal processing protease n=1 Tax=Alkalicoccobacillus murimartini TaxID=171685 RepID=A0ABT9YFY0_9BACI|nr:carboxyl-terminal processing protease [Alkalicoccobacillus murimartini]
MNSKRLFIVVVLVALLGAGSYYVTGMFSSEASPVAPGQEGSEQVDTVELSDDELMKKFEKALSTIEGQYVEEVDRKQLIEGAISGMVEELGDPFSDYMDQETANEFVESLGSEFQGIGAEVSMINGKVTIVSPFRDSPAEQAGLQANDRIIEIDGENIEGLTVNEAVLKIRGEKGTTVRLTIERDGSTELLEVPVERDTIPIETVRTETFEQDGQTIGLLEITSFSEDTAINFKDQLSQLEADGIDALLIDVRGNPGGYLNAVEQIGDELIPEGKAIVQTEDRAGDRTGYSSQLEGTKDYPIIGLIDERSASASEILAAALKESGGYDLVGNTTFGKGTVQQTVDLGDGSDLKLTMMRWLTPDGNSINEEGVTPTIEENQPEYFFSTAVSVEDDPITFDSLGEQVKNAQLILKGLDFEPGREDGYFDQQTVDAVKAFQESVDIEATGEINQETATALQERIVEEIRKSDNDVQLQKAIELAVEQSNQ